MIDPDYISTLQRIKDRISDVEWVITGSTGMKLQGMPLDPNDIDIQTNESGAYNIEKIFSDNVIREVEFIENDDIRSHFGELGINGIKIELMGDLQKKINGVWEEPIDINKYKEIVEIDGNEFPVMSLKYEYYAYLRLRREKRAKKIRKWIRNNEYLGDLDE